MNRQPISSARDADLRLSQQALERAARRVHELAARTGTLVVVSRQGVVEWIEAMRDERAPAVQEPSASYGGER